MGPWELAGPPGLAYLVKLQANERSCCLNEVEGA